MMAVTPTSSGMSPAKAMAPTAKAVTAAAKRMAAAAERASAAAETVTAAAKAVPAPTEAGCATVSAPEHMESPSGMAGVPAIRITRWPAVAAAEARHLGWNPVTLAAPAESRTRSRVPS